MNDLIDSVRAYPPDRPSAGKLSILLVKTSADHGTGITQSCDRYGQVGDDVGDETDLGTTIYGKNRGDTIPADVFCTAWLWPWGIGNGPAGADVYEIFPITCDAGAVS